MEHIFTNELINETSPYLLQHAHNPVEWHPWGETALAKSKAMDKPILVSIGYAACHWCHVMERESFENEEVAKYMNEHFVNIKIDREERPDLDHIYMDAVQAIAGNGGWPLNVFLTTEAKPFYGGTYFPPQKAFNRPSWTELLSYINDIWKNQREEVEKQAEILLQHINSSGNIVAGKLLTDEFATSYVFTAEQCRQIADNILKTADTRYGGFGNAPKFPQTFSIQYLLAFGHFFKDKKALQQAELSLRKMTEGGIYDHLAGGMSRYSTDAAWLVPHFEKMLYDNALLVTVLCDAYQVTKDDFYRETAEKTLQFLIKEMQDPAGGFYAAFDADSEGVEGKFYVWDKAEIDEILKEDSKIFCDYYGITATGNWEHKNILNVVLSKEVVARENNIEIGQLTGILDSAEKKLLAKRSERVKPAIDDKIILGWNALLVTAFCKAAAAFGSDEHKNNAVLLFDFLLNKFNKNGKITHHTYKNGQARHPACLDDFAYLIQASIQLQEITGNQTYLGQAHKLTGYVIANFLDTKAGFFYYTHQDQDDIVARKLEIYDGATASGNSTMAANLLYLAMVFDEQEWSAIANKMLIALMDILVKYPGSFAVWANLVIRQMLGANEIAITGKNTSRLLKDVLKIYLPGKVLQSAEVENDLPLLKNKIYGERPLIFLCRNYACLAPVDAVADLEKLLKINTD